MKTQEIALLRSEIAKSKAISDQWEAELKNLDLDKDYYEYLCTEEMISQAKMNQAYLEHQIENLINT